MSKETDVVTQLLKLAETPEQVKFLMESDATQLRVEVQSLRQHIEDARIANAKATEADKTRSRTYERVIELMLKTATKGSYLNG